MIEAPRLRAGGMPKLQLHDVTQYQSLGTQRGIGFVLDNLAWASAAISQSRRAARLLGAAAALFESVEATTRRSPSDVALEELEAAMATARDSLGEAEWMAAFAEGRALSLEEAIAEALGERE